MKSAHQNIFCRQLASNLSLFSANLNRISSPLISLTNYSGNSTSGDVYNVYIFLPLMMSCLVLVWSPPSSAWSPTWRGSPRASSSTCPRSDSRSTLSDSRKVPEKKTYIKIAVNHWSQNENKQLQEPLPGCGTLICRTRLRDVYDTYDTFAENQTNILVEGMSNTMSSWENFTLNFSWALELRGRFVWERFPEFLPVQLLLCAEVGTGGKQEVLLSSQEAPVPSPGLCCWHQHPYWAWSC